MLEIKGGSIGRHICLNAIRVVNAHAWAKSTATAGEPGARVFVDEGGVRLVNTTDPL